MSRIYSVFLGIGLIFILGCSQQQETVPPSPVPFPENDYLENVIASEDISEGQGIVKEFSMIAKQWEFVPEIIEVNKGDTVRITVTSTDVAHSFSLPSFNINERLTPDEPVTIEFVADKVGTFPFRCNVFCGSGHSAMAGTMVVQ